MQAVDTKGSFELCSTAVGVWQTQADRSPCLGYVHVTTTAVADAVAPIALHRQ